MLYESHTTVSKSKQSNKITIPLQIMPMLSYYMKQTTLHTHVFHPIKPPPAFVHNFFFTTVRLTDKKKGCKYVLKTEFLCNILLQKNVTQLSYKTNSSNYMTSRNRN